MIRESSWEVFCLGACEITPGIDPVQPGSSFSQTLVSHVTSVHMGEGFLGGVEASEEVPPLHHSAQALEDRGDFGGGQVGCVFDIVNCVPVPCYDPCLAGVKEEVGKRITKDGLSFCLACRTGWQIDIAKGDPVNLKVQDAATRESFDIFNFE